MKSNLDESSYMKKREDTNRHYTKRKRTPDSHVNIMQLSRIHFIKPDTGLDEPDIKLDTLVKPSWWNLIVPNLKMSLHHRSYNLGVKMLLAGKRWKKAKKVACGEAWQRVWERDYDSDIVGLYSCYYILQTAFSGLDSLLKYRHFKS